MDFLIAWLHGIALAAGFWGVVLVAFLQEVIPPLPSTLISASLGFLLFTGKPITTGVLGDLFFQIGLPIAIGLTVGSVIIYYIVAWGGMAIIDRWGTWIGVSRGDIEKLQNRLEGRVVDDVLLFVARSLPLVPSVAVNIVAGIVRWKIVPFILLTFFGTIIRAMWSAAIGWQLGSAFESYAAKTDRIHTWIVIGVAIGAALFIWYRRNKKRQNATIPPLTS